MTEMNDGYRVRGFDHLLHYVTLLVTAGWWLR
jgi:hypothetical protein